MRRLLLAGVAVAGALSAQSNTVAGLDGRLEILDNPTHIGHRGTFPNGEEGMAMRNPMCNPGSVDLPWFAVPQTDHPKFGFLFVRVSDGRMVQISDRSFCKHAFTSASGNGGCGTCNGVGGNHMGLRCSDTYGATLNGSPSGLGPPEEIDPWLGTWNMIGSYFDRGDPDVGPPANTDGSTSLNTSGFDTVKNRVTIKDSELNVTGASFFYGIQLIHQGEAVANRGDNLASRGVVPSWTGSGWSFTNNSIGQVWGSILQHWTGSNLNSGGNGSSDGRFFVASKVSPIAGGFHYEYAVHNVDNSRGGASFRVPVAAAATVSNFGFRDIDSDALNQWTASRVGNEIVFTAPANNPLNWNSIFNFWFDCSQAPSSGIVTLDEARIGAGALQVTVLSDTPSGGTPVAFNTNIGTGCSGAASGPCQSSAYELFSTPGAFDLANSSLGLSLVGNNYVLGLGSGGFISPTGTTLTLSDDSATTVALPFTLSFPGGSTTQLVVCSNGFISPISNGTSFTPSGGGFVAGTACWAACWHDLNPGVGGQVLASVSAGAVRISFVGVPTFGGTGSHTFQYEFLPNSQVNIYWQAMTTSGQSYLVGWTSGGQPDPGSQDLSVLRGTGLSLCPATGSVPPPLSLNAGARPVLGTTVPMTTTGVPTGTALQAIVYSLQQSVPPIDLTSLGMPNCQAHMASFDYALTATNPASATLLQSLPIPNQSYLVGVTVTVQAFTNTPGVNALGFLTSNGILMFLAAL